MTKISKYRHQIRFFQAQNAPKSVSDWGSAPNHDASDPLVGWRGDTPPHSPLPLTPLASRFSGPLSTNSWLRQWSL